MTVYTRKGKDAVKVGDSVRVSPSLFIHVGGGELRDRGWSGGKVLRFIDHEAGLLAEVTVPGRASTRTIPANRLTRLRSKS